MNAKPDISLYNIASHGDPDNTNVSFRVRKIKGMTPTEVYGFSFSIFFSPTNNCQLASISAVENLLENVPIEFVIPILEECFNRCEVNPKIILLDVKERVANKVMSIFDIREMLPYTSTNRSKMCIFLVNSLPSFRDYMVSFGKT